jgi:predicted ester cyclase
MNTSVSRADAFIAGPMGPEERKAAVLAFFDRAWARQDLSAIDDYYHEDVTLHLAGYSEPFRGREAVKEWISTYQRAFPDIAIEISSIVAAGDDVFLRWRSTQTHLGEYLGVAPLGQRVSMDVLQLSRFEGDLATEIRVVFDPLRVLQQLGVLPDGPLPRPLMAVINPIRRLRRSRAA